MLNETKPNNNSNTMSDSKVLHLGPQNSPPLIANQLTPRLKKLINSFQQMFTLAKLLPIGVKSAHLCHHKLQLDQTQTSLLTIPDIYTCINDVSMVHHIYCNPTTMLLDFCFFLTDIYRTACLCMLGWGFIQKFLEGRCEVLTNYFWIN